MREYKSNTIYGHDEAEARMLRETMTRAPYHVAVDHNWYSNNPEFAKRKMKEVNEGKELSPYEVGYTGRMSKNKTDDNAEKRLHKACGGAAKWRKEYPGSMP